MKWVVVLLVVFGFVFTFVVNFNKGRNGPRPPKTTGDHFNVLGKPFECTVCGHTKFSQRSAQLKPNESARCFVCQSCGYVHWFVT